MCRSSLELRIEIFLFICRVLVVVDTLAIADIPRLIFDFNDVGALDKVLLLEADLIVSKWILILYLGSIDFDPMDCFSSVVKESIFNLTSYSKLNLDLTEESFSSSKQRICDLVLNI